MPNVTLSRDRGSGTVLIVDDDPATVSSISTKLRCGGLTMFEAYTGKGAVTSALEHRPDVLVLDYRLGVHEMTALDVIDTLRARLFYPTWILYSQYMSFDLAVDAGRRNAFKALVLALSDIEAEVMRALIATREGKTGGWPPLPVGPMPVIPHANAAKGAAWILVACDSNDDLRSFSAWATFADASERRMRDVFEQMALDSVNVRTFMRLFRALARARGHVGNAVAEMDVGDARTLKRMLDKAGLNAPPGARIALEYFLRVQTLVPFDHSVVESLRSLCAMRNLPGLSKP